ncbi:MAG: hypothetical protein AAFR81_01455 [Chloroflexota bacterium]
MTITYQITIDQNDDGIFSVDERITAAVLRAEWQLGLASAESVLSQTARATITVNNRDRAFSPELTSTLIGKRLRIQSDDGTTVRTHFTGAIDSILPTTGQVTANGHPPQADIIVLGRERELAQQTVSLPLQTDVRADTLIQQILDSVSWRYAVLDGRCIIGRDSIGSSDIFPTQVISTQLDTGKSVFPYIGGVADESNRALDWLQRVVSTEDGYFFFNREGDAIFYNRHHLLTNDTVQATFDDDMTELIYDFGTVYNDLSLTLYPRRLGADNTILWSLNAPLAIDRDSFVTLRVAYNVDDIAVGAVDVVTPIAEYQAFSHATILTNDQTSAVRVIARQINVDDAVLEIRNQSNRKIYLTELALRGTPLIADQAVTLNQQDSYSMARFGRYPRSYDMPLLNDVDEAKDMLAYDLSLWSEPCGIVRQLHTDTQHHPTEVLARRLFDRITIREHQSGHDANYHIITEQHVLDKGGARHRVQWRLLPALSERFFIIGTHSIGDDVVLVPR